MTIINALINPQTLFLFAILSAGSLAVAIVAARWVSAPLPLLLLALLSVSGVIAVTLSSDGAHISMTSYAPRIQTCLHNLPHDLLYQAPKAVNTTEGLLNVVLFIPVGFFFALLTRRPLITAVCCAAFSGAIELVQAWEGSRGCSSSDFVTNSIGAIIGTLLAIALTQIVRRARASAN